MDAFSFRRMTFKSLTEHNIGRHLIYYYTRNEEKSFQFNTQKTREKFLLKINQTLRFFFVTKKTLKPVGLL